MKKLVATIIVLSIIINLFITTTFGTESGLNISAKAAVVMCLDTKEIIFGKNISQKLPMASTTKIMTALILSEQPDLSKAVTVTKKMVAVEGSSMGLLEGDIVSFRDLLYGMLLASGNDAANVTAYVLGGSVEGFAKMMNKKAQELGLKDTNFVTPSGLDDENHYTTAYDLAVLTSEALKNDAFATACSSTSATLYYGNPPYRRSLSNHNKLLSSYEGLIGVKTGFTKRSGRCLVTAAKRDDKSVICVTLNDPNDWEDHKNLLDYGFANTVSNSFSCDDREDTLPIICGDADLVRIRYESVNICSSEKGFQKIKRVIVLPKFIYGSVLAGESIGRVEYYLGNQLIKTADVFSVANIKLLNKKDKFLNRFSKSFTTLMSYI